MEILILLVVFGLMLTGLASIPFGFPGVLLIFASILIYAYSTDFASPMRWPFLLVMAALAGIAETADNWLTMAGARKFGASTRAMWLSILGGLLGALFIGGPMAILLGPLGPVAGGFLGAFAIVALYEYRRLGNWRDALRAGWGTFLGRMAGMLLKIVIATAMIGAAAIAILS